MRSVEQFEVLTFLLFEFECLIKPQLHLFWCPPQGQACWRGKIAHFLLRLTNISNVFLFNAEQSQTLSYCKETMSVLRLFSSSATFSVNRGTLCCHGDDTVWDCVCWVSLLFMSLVQFRKQKPNCRNHR